MLKLISDPEANTTYLIHGMRRFKGAMGFNSGMKKTLEFTPNAADKSLVSIVMDLESLKVIKTESVGAIIEAYVFRAGASSFDSMSRDGTMAVKIGNFGDLKSDYIVTVTNCNMNINHAIPQQSRTLEPYEETTLSFDINTQYNLDTSNECLVTLKGTTGRIYDKVAVGFDTEKHKSKYSCWG